MPLVPHVGQAEAEGLPCLPVAHSRDGFGEGCEAAPPVCSGGQQRDWAFGTLPELEISPIPLLTHPMGWALDWWLSGWPGVSGKAGHNRTCFITIFLCC